MENFSAVLTWMGIGLLVGLVVYVIALFLKGSKAKGGGCYTRDGYYQDF